MNLITAFSFWLLLNIFSCVYWLFCCEIWVQHSVLKYGTNLLTFLWLVFIFSRFIYRSSTSYGVFFVGGQFLLLSKIMFIYLCYSYVNSSFILLLEGIPWCGYTMVCLSTYLLVGCFQLLAVKNKPAYKHLCTSFCMDTLFPFLFGKYLEWNSSIIC